MFRLLVGAALTTWFVGAARSADLSVTLVAQPLSTEACKNLSDKAALGTKLSEEEKTALIGCYSPQALPWPLPRGIAPPVITEVPGLEGGAV